MVTLAEAQEPGECHRPGCPTCYPAQVAVIEEGPVEQAPIKSQSWKDSAKAAIAAATGAVASSLDALPDRPAPDFTALDDDGS